MKSNLGNVATGSSSFPLGLLGVLFVALKLTGYITWSWWWVTIPFWGGLAIAALLGLFGVAMMALAKLLS